jgi:hypothetical protein
MTLSNSFSGKGKTYKARVKGQAPSSQRVGSLLRTPWPAKPDGKMDSTNSQWKIINRKQIAKLQHLSRLKASAFLFEFFFHWVLRNTKTYT